MKTKYRIVEIVSNGNVTYVVEKRIFFLFWIDSDEFFFVDYDSLENAKTHLKDWKNRVKDNKKTVVYEETI